MPPTVPINHYFGSRNQRKIEPKSPIPLFHAYVSKCKPALNTVTFSTRTQLRAAKSAQKRPTPAVTYLTADRRHRAQNPTTSFLTATTLQYNIGPGITVAARTRLALQLVPR